MPISTTGGTFQGQASSASTQPVDNSLFGVNFGKQPPTAIKKQENIVASSTIAPNIVPISPNITPVAPVITPTPAVNNTTINNISTTPTPKLDTLNVLDSLVGASASGVDIANARQDYINTTGKQNNADILKAESTILTTGSQLADATARTDIANAQITSDTTNEILQSTIAYNRQMEESSKTTLENTRVNLEQQKLSLANKIESQNKQAIDNQKITAYRATYQAAMSGSSLSQASISSIGNAVDASLTKLIEVQSTLELQKSDFSIKAGELLNTVTNNYLQVAKTAKTENAKLRAEYGLALIALNNAKELGPIKAQLAKAELARTFSTRKDTLEKAYLDEVKNANANIIAQSNVLLANQKLRQTETLAEYDQDIASGVAYKYTNQQLQQIADRTGNELSVVIARRDNLFKSKVAEYVLKSGAEATPAQIEGWSALVGQYARSGMPVDAALAMVSGSINRYVRDTSQQRTIDANRASTLSNVNTNFAVQDAVKRELVARGQTSQVVSGSLPNKNEIVTAKEPGFYKGKYGVLQCGEYINSSYGLTGANRFGDSLQSKKDAIASMNDGQSFGGTPQIGGFIVWDTGNKLSDGTKTGHVGRVVGYDGENVMIEQANWKNDGKVEVITKKVSDLKEPWMSRSLTDVQKVDTTGVNATTGLDAKGNTIKLTEAQKTAKSEAKKTYDALVNIAKNTTTRPESGLWTDNGVAKYEANGNSSILSGLPLANLNVILRDNIKPNESSESNDIFGAQIKSNEAIMAVDPTAGGTIIDSIPAITPTNAPSTPKKTTVNITTKGVEAMPLLKNDLPVLIEDANANQSLKDERKKEYDTKMRKYLTYKRYNEEIVPEYNEQIEILKNKYPDGTSNIFNDNEVQDKFDEEKSILIKSLRNKLFSLNYDQKLDSFVLGSLSLKLDK